MIIYIHGALSTRRSFTYLAQELRGVNVPQRYFSYDVRAVVAHKIVDDLVAYVSNLNPKGSLTFIAHSYGGVLAVEAVRKLQLPCNVISMSTPYGGSAMASLLRVMKPSSKFFDNIGSYNSFMRGFSAKPLPCRVRGLVTTAGSAEWLNEANDGVVTVGSQRHFKNDSNWSEVEVDLNHFEVLLSPKVAGLVKKEVSRFHTVE